MSTPPLLPADRRAAKQAAPSSRTTATAPTPVMAATRCPRSVSWAEPPPPPPPPLGPAVVAEPSGAGTTVRGGVRPSGRGAAVRVARPARSVTSGVRLVLEVAGPVSSVRARGGGDGVLVDMLLLLLLLLAARADGLSLPLPLPLPLPPSPPRCSAPLFGASRRVLPPCGLASASGRSCRAIMHSSAAPTGGSLQARRRLCLLWAGGRPGTRLDEPLARHAATAAAARVMLLDTSAASPHLRVCHKLEHGVGRTFTLRSALWERKKRGFDTFQTTRATPT